MQVYLSVCVNMTARESVRVSANVRVPCSAIVRVLVRVSAYGMVWYGLIAFAVHVHRQVVTSRQLAPPVV